MTDHRAVRGRRLAAALAVAVLLLVHGAPAAEPAATTTAPPTSTTTVPPRPALESGPDTPRGAVARFFAAVRAGRYAQAAEYLNLAEIPRSQRAGRGPALAGELEVVLERALPVDPDELSDQPDGETGDGLPPLRDSLGTVESPDGPVEIVIERVSQPGGAVWKFSTATVAAIPALYDEYGWGALGDVLPAPFFVWRFLDIRLWQWVALVLVVWGATLFGLLATALAARIARAVLARRGGDDRLVQYTVAPFRLAAGVAAFAVALPYLRLAARPYRVLVAAETALAIVAITWGFLRVLDVLAVQFEHRLAAHRHMRAVAAVPLGRRTLKVFIGIVALIAALENFGFNVTGVLAGLGVGGLAVALAAQKTVENLFGSVSLVADQPVRVGDVCRFGDTVGRVEDIGLRSTRLRTVDRDTLVTIPNAQFSTLALENLSRRDRLPVRAKLTLPATTPPDRIRDVLGKLRALLADEDKVEGHSARARFTGITAQGFEIDLYAFVATESWEEFAEIRERIFLRALDAIGAGASMRSG